MKAQAGQILQQEPEAGVSLLQAAAAPTLTGIMAVVPAEAQAVTVEATGLIRAITVKELAVEEELT